ncbi:hypothetical protein [Staphylococcus pseudoxylosus]|uniref:hypothetical protein n=1 Tax=Staphylococcus pseudoxylosus TaxID=2282419 RepID=UPI000D1F24B9|nr:hypothetical protein [Staphylococcus pseudoxylosus]MEB5783617.1 hypothetical protein [Staphylococcus pseudoxylosus]PTI82087.1 hypothetical protein BU098_07620 [Staphylococcus xylosus]
MAESIIITSKTYKELKSKSRAWDNYISELREKKTEELKIAFSAMLNQQVDKEVKKIEQQYMEDE